MKNNIEQKVKLFISFAGLVFLAIAVRLYYLQIIKGDYYNKRSESNFVQERYIKHNRGKILDSSGRVLADNRVSYDVFVTFSMLPDSIRTLRLIASTLKLKSSDLKDYIEEFSLRNENKIDEYIPLRENVQKANCEKLSKIVNSQSMNGVRLISKKKSQCDVWINPAYFPNQKETISYLEEILQRNTSINQSWEKAKKKAQGLGRFKPTLLVEDVGYEAYAKIENSISLGLLSGITVVPSQRRRYIYDNLATHLIGYLNQVSVKELQDSPDKYRSGDYIGRKGVEATFEDYLRGIDGIERVVVDAKGRRFSESWEEELLGQSRIVEPKSGMNIKLSIDYDMQKAAEEFFLGKSGSVVVMDVNSGFIHAMASFPNFNPNLLVSGDNSNFFNSLLQDKTRPFRNKVVQDHYSPGSIFKPFTALSGLTYNLITPSYHHNCTGVYQIHKTSWRCFLRTGHGPIGLTDALKKSCDGFFYELGHRLGLERLSSTAFALGFGQRSGIDLQGEAKGIVPNRDYYLKRFGYASPGFVVNMSIGQGDLAVTPLQMAVAYSALANGGIVYKPQFVKEILSSDGKSVQKFDKEIKNILVEGVENYDEIITGLSYVTEQGGSAYSIRYLPAFSDLSSWIKGKVIIGKTGTAQVVKLAKNIDHVRAEDVPYEQRDHAWFVGLYPAQKPEIVVVVMTEHAGFGSTFSAPVAVRLMKKWDEKNQVVLGNANVE